MIGTPPHKFLSHPPSSTKIFSTFFLLGRSTCFHVAENVPVFGGCSPLFWRVNIDPPPTNPSLESPSIVFPVCAPFTSSLPLQRGLSSVCATWKSFPALLSREHFLSAVSSRQHSHLQRNLASLPPSAVAQFPFLKPASSVSFPPFFPLPLQRPSGSSLGLARPFFAACSRAQLEHEDLSSSLQHNALKTLFARLMPRPARSRRSRYFI